MKTAYIALTYKCNHSCIFCPCTKETKLSEDIDINNVLKILKRWVHEEGVKQITISGGEPSIYSNFLDIIKYLGSADVNVTILSNSSGFNNKNMVNQMSQLIDRKRLNITTALHSHIPENHDVITNVNGSFNETLSGLHTLLDNKIRLTIKHCITKKNYKDISKFVDFFYQEFNDLTSLLICNIDYCGTAFHNWESLAVKFSESRPFLEQALDKVLEYKKNQKVIVAETPLCSVDPYYWRFFSVYAKKGVTYYCDPRIFQGNINSNFLNIQGNDCGTFFDGCRSCDVVSICSGAWKSACKLFGESECHAIKSQLH